MTKEQMTVGTLYKLTRKETHKFLTWNFAGYCVLLKNEYTDPTPGYIVTWKLKFLCLTYAGSWPDYLMHEPNIIIRYWDKKNWIIEKAKGAPNGT